MSAVVVAVSPQARTYPLLGIAGVLFGAAIATFLGRLISVGSGDLRGALHLDYDTATWMGTSYNMGLMFVGPFSVFAGALLGTRRVLLVCATLFTFLCVLIPFVGDISVVLVLLGLAGVTAGTFYPLTLSFILRSLPQQFILFGIAVYGIDAMVTTHLAHSYEAWMMHHLSWRWIFWTNALLTVPMLAFVYLGIPSTPVPKPKSGEQGPNWSAFLFGSLGGAFLYGCLDQGQHLDWWRSSTFVAMLLTGTFLLGASLLVRIVYPNPLVRLPFLQRKNTALLAIVLFFFRFILLGTVVLVPNYLANVQGYGAEQTGQVLLWSALPQFLAGILAVYLLERIDARILLASGLLLCGMGCLMNATLGSEWSGMSFHATQLVLSFGEGFTLNGLVGSILLDILNSGSMNRGIELLTFSGFFQIVRLIGGELGTSFMLFFLQRREQFHSNALGLHIQSGSPIVADHLRFLAMGLLPTAPDPDIASERAAALLGLSVRKQAFTLATIDCFLLVALSCVASMVIVSMIGSLSIQYKQLLATLKPRKP